MSFRLGPQLANTIVAHSNADSSIVVLLDGLAAPAERRRTGESDPLVAWRADPWTNVNGILYCTSSVIVKIGATVQERYLNLIRGEVALPTHKVVLQEVEGKKFSLCLRRVGDDLAIDVPKQLDVKRIREYVGQLRGVLVLGTTAPMIVRGA